MKITINSSEFNKIMPIVSYSDKMNKDVDLLIKQKVVPVINYIKDSIKDTERKKVADISFMVDPTADHVSIVIHKKKGEIVYGFEELDTESKLRLKEMVQLIHQFSIPQLNQPSAEVLPSPFKARPVPIESNTKVNLIVRIFRNLQYWISSLLTVEPAVKKFVSTYFASIHHLKELEEAWKKIDEASDSIITTLHEKLNKGRTKDQEIFSKADLRQNVNAALEKQFLSLYKKFSGKIFSTQETRLMRNQPKMHEAAQLFNTLTDNLLEHLSEDFRTTQDIEDDIEIKLDELEDLHKTTPHLHEEIVALENELTELEELKTKNLEFDKSQFTNLQEAQKKFSELIDSMPSMEIPLEGLSSVPLNVFTEQSLLSTWMRILEDLKTEGALSTVGESKDPTIISKQTHYGDTYLLALQLLPKELEGMIPKDEKVNNDKIETFIRAQPNAMGLRSLPKNDMQKRQQQIYQEMIRPFLDKQIKSLLEDSVDFIPIAEILSNPQSTTILDLIKKIENKLERYNISADERVTMKLTREDLTKLIACSFEELGMEKYYIPGDQIIRLQDTRLAKIEEIEQLAKTDKAIDQLKIDLHDFSKSHESLEADYSDEDQTEELAQKKVALEIDFKDYLGTLFENLPFDHTSIKKVAEIPVNKQTQPGLLVMWDFWLDQVKPTPDLSSSLLVIIKNEHLFNTIKRETLSIEGADFKHQRLKLLEKIEKPEEPTQSLIRKFELLNESAAQFEDRVAALEALIPRETFSLPEYHVSLSKAPPLVLKNYLTELQAEVDVLTPTITKRESEIASLLKKINAQQSKKHEIPKKLTDQLEKLKTFQVEQKNQKETLLSEMSQIMEKLKHPATPLDLSKRVTMKAREVSIDNLKNADVQMIKEILNTIRKQSGGTANDPRSLNEAVYAHILNEYKKYEKALDEVEMLREEKGKILSPAYEKVSQAIQEQKPSEMRFTELTSLTVNEANEDLIYDLWEELLLKTISEKQEIVSTMNEKDPFRKQKMQTIIFQMDAILQALEKVDHPTINEHIQELADQYETELDNLNKDAHFELNAELEEQALNTLKPTIFEELYAEVHVPASTLPPVTEKYLTPYEIENMKILSKALESFDEKKSVDLTEDEKKAMELFVKYATTPGAQSKSLNGKLYEMLKKKTAGLRDTLLEHLIGTKKVDDRFFTKIPFGMSQHAVQFLVDIPYDLRLKKEFIPATQKLATLVHKIENKEEIKKEDRLTVHEMGIIQKAVYVGTDYDDQPSRLTELENLGLLNEELVPLRDNAAVAETLLEKLNVLFQNEAKIHYHTGDLVAHVGRKEFEFNIHKMNAEETLHVNLITPYTHGAKIYQEKDVTMLSHIVDKYRQDTLNITEDLYSEVWRIDVSALVPRKMKRLMQEKYGDGWKEKIQKKYEEFESRIHKQEKKQFSHFSNTWQRRLEAGKADYIWGGHKRKSDADFNQLAERIMGDQEAQKDHYTDMICSEFVTKSTIASLVYMDRFYSEELGQFLMDKGKVKEGEKLKTSKNVLQLPYSKKEKLKAVHPGRMIDLLKKSNCLSRVPHVPLVQQLMVDGKL